MLEKVLGALSFSTNATLKITPFEGYHDQEAKTVLSNLMKKPSLNNLNRSNVLKDKSADLDESDAAVQETPHPADRTWGVRLDSEYGARIRNHPLRLTDSQANNKGNDSMARFTEKSSKEAGLSGMVFQTTTEQNLGKYILHKTIILVESAHTLKMSNGGLIRKSGVAI